VRKAATATAAHSQRADGGGAEASAGKEEFDTVGGGEPGFAEKRSSPRTLPQDMFGETVPADVASARERARSKQTVEFDVSGFVLAALPQETANHSGGMVSASSMANVFDDVMWRSGMSSEFQPEEEKAYKQRFLYKMKSVVKTYQDCLAEENALTRMCEGYFRKDTSVAMDIEKPLMTESLAQSYNRARLGFTVEMKPHMIHETEGTLRSRLGRSAVASGQKEHFDETANAFSNMARRNRAFYPEEFDSRTAEKWSYCKEALNRVYNQGSCGNCWVFGGLGPMDSRMCIYRKGAYQGSLSRSYATSCITEGTGCNGGWEYYTWKYIQQQGLCPTECIEYDSTQIQDTCPSRCTNSSFTISLDESLYRPIDMGSDLTSSSSGLGYSIFLPPDDHWDIIKANMYDHGPVAMGIFVDAAFQAYVTGVYSICFYSAANHAVQAVGWGPDYIIGANSWGEDWGVGGFFYIKDCVPTDISVPGVITQSSWPQI